MDILDGPAFLDIPERQVTLVGQELVVILDGLESLVTLVGLVSQVTLVGLECLDRLVLMVHLVILDGLV